jgi:hypothetical protein
MRSCDGHHRQIAAIADAPDPKAKLAEVREAHTSSSVATRRRQAEAAKMGTGSARATEKTNQIKRHPTGMQTYGLIDYACNART